MHPYLRFVPALCGTLAIAPICSGQAAAQLWMQTGKLTVNANAWTLANHVRCLPSGSFVVGGDTEKGAGRQRDGFVACYSRNGPRLWFQEIDGNANQDYYVEAFAADSLGNSYLVGESDTGTADSSSYWARIDSTGAVGYSISFQSCAGFETYTDTAVDSLGRLFACGQQEYAPGDPRGFMNLRSVTGGNQGGGGSLLTNTTWNAIAMSSLDEPHITGNDVIGSGEAANLFQAIPFNWGSPIGPVKANDIAVDAAGNFFITGSITDPFGPQDIAFVRKYNAARVFQWQKTYSVAPGNLAGKKVFIDPLGHVVVIAQGFSGGFSTVDYIRLFGTSGAAISWVTYHTPAFNDEFSDAVMDQYGETYVAANRTLGGSSIGEVLRFSLNGALRWSKTITIGANYIDLKGVAVHNASGDVCAVGSDLNSDNGVVALIRQAPIAVADAGTAKSNILKSFASVLANDKYAKGGTVSVVANPAHGNLVLNAAGTFTYQSVAAYTGPDSFQYRVTKAGVTSSVATVSLTVTP